MLPGCGLCMELGSKPGIFLKPLSVRAMLVPGSEPAAPLPFSNCRTLWNPYQEVERGPGMHNAHDFLLMSHALLPVQEGRTSEHKFFCCSGSQSSLCASGGPWRGPCTCVEPHAILACSCLPLSVHRHFNR